MISDSSKKRTLSIGPKRTNLVRTYSTSFSGMNLELFFTFLFGGIFLTIFLFSDDVLLEELSKAILIISLLSLFRFLKPNSNNLK